MSDATRTPSAEEWRPVVGFEGTYEVSDLGRVRSLPRVDRLGRAHLGVMLSQARSDKYAKVTLKVDGRQWSRNVHRLVAEAFLGPCPPGLEVCHNNGHAFDNRVENLRYDTHASNAQDVIRHGTHHRNGQTHCKRGHEFTAQNTRLNGAGSRVCRTCESERGKRKRRSPSWS